MAEEEAPKIVPSRRNGEKLVYQGFSYRLKHKMSNGDKTWQCDDTASNYKAGCKTHMAERALVATVTRPHCHEPKPDRVNNMQ
eukprot:8424931-Karenia_brevis.AAC.1